MQNTSSIKLKITSPTGSRGTSAYNMGLSERRVEKTKEYLVLQGVDANRLALEAYGEDHLTNECDGYLLFKGKTSIEYEVGVYDFKLVMLNSNYS